ncbi:potassium transporter 11-like isoform X2 [Carya illinoinensis]|uniref:potassium transporter 11-like isoform X2 n=1 Tax=Carya illinoinensis TaxID=32201 RepID=UPI001C719FBD|nr:potassium transporter 11-like isoform X2 [Carya illinoinensis]
MRMASIAQTSENIDRRGGMWILDQKLDQPMEEEAKRLRNMYKEKKFSALLVLQLAFQSLGVVYGDLGTSPLYVFYNTFSNRIEDPEDLIGALSLIIYSLSLVPLLKYVFIVCRANDNGQVLSAVGGINVGHTVISNDVVVLVAVVIIVGLFSMQHFGTDKVGWLFAPVVLVWFILIGGIGIFNIWRYDSSVLKAFSPLYIYRYFKRGGRGSWTSLGGIMLSITGTEALFADLSHFPVSSIQIAFTVIVFPCLLLSYSGQAAYLLKNPDNVVGAFYHSIPDSIYWPVFLVATGAAVVASQATISATFSLVKQALALGCFPRVKIIHTSKTFHNQIYIPDINWILMILCIAVTVGFKNQTQIGNASGTAVVIVMLVTTLLMTLIMILVWRCHWIIVLIFTGLSLVVECTYFSAVLLKVNQGGWVPLVIAAAFYIIMYVWHYGTAKRYETELHSKVSMAWILGLGPSLGLVRVPGIGLVYSELASGVPHIFSHFITNLPALHSVVVFVCVKYLPVHKVPEEERFLVKRIGPKSFHMFRCVARYGYQDHHKKDTDFEKKLFDSLFLFIRLESLMEGCSDSDVSSLLGEETAQSDNILVKSNDNSPHSNLGNTVSSSDSIVLANSSSHANNRISEIEMDELEFLNNCRDIGVVHILGNTAVKARRDSKFYKKIAIDYIYAFLRKICRENSAIFNVPQESLLNVGQILYV